MTTDALPTCAFLTPPRAEVTKSVAELTTRGENRATINPFLPAFTFTEDPSLNWSTAV